MLKVERLEETKRNLKKFIKLAWKFYKDDKDFVPPLINDKLKILQGVDNALFENGEHAFFMAYRDGEAVGRLLVGIDEKLNQDRGINQGYLSMFECENNQETANALFDAAAAWLRERGIANMTGPYSPNYDDFDKGMLYEGFNGPPVLFNPYNPRYYVDLFVNAGFEKEKDHYAYYFNLEDFKIDKYEKVCDFAIKTFGYRLERICLSGEGMERHIKYVTEITQKGMPEEWDQLRPPTEDEIRDEFMQLRSLADRDLIYICLVDDKPVGWIMAMPNYSEVLIKMKGRMLPFGFIHFLRGRKKIKGMRAIILFVIPEYHNKACTGVLMRQLYKSALKKGYRWGEGSTVDETNQPSMRTVEKAGGAPYRTYRVFEKNVI